MMYKIGRYSMKMMSRTLKTISVTLKGTLRHQRLMIFKSIKVSHTKLAVTLSIKIYWNSENCAAIYVTNCDDSRMGSMLQQNYECCKNYFHCIFYTSFSHMRFLKYNAALTFSTAVQCMFSVGKDVLKPKRACLSNEDFEMLVFLKD